MLDYILSYLLITAAGASIGMEVALVWAYFKMTGSTSDADPNLIKANYFAHANSLFLTLAIMFVIAIRLPGNLHWVYLLFAAGLVSNLFSDLLAIKVMNSRLDKKDSLEKRTELLKDRLDLLRREYL